MKWTTVCSPKKEGGLGLKDLLVWNKVFALKLIFLLFSKSDSLWVAWCRSCKLKRSSFWSLSVKSGGSSMWKQILKLRPLARGFLNCDLGDGKLCKFWWDSWTPFGPLIDFVGQEGPRLMGVPKMATVSDTITGAGWIFFGC